MRFSLEQFSGVFKIRNADGQPFILIGGQAVNWLAQWRAKQLNQGKRKPVSD